MPPTTRGALYLVWGDAKKTVNRSVESLKRVHPDLEVKIVQFPDDANVLIKSKMFELTPFDQTVFLDADTVVLGRLDFGFAQAERFSLACCVNECPWARRYKGLEDRGELVEYNTGVVFFNRQAEPVFQRWQERVMVDSVHRFMLPGGKVGIGLYNDQAGFATAVDELGFNPFVLPLNWNFRPAFYKSFFGPIRVWHDYGEPFPQLAAHNVEQSKNGALIQFIRME